MSEERVLKSVSLASDLKKLEKEVNINPPLRQKEGNNRDQMEVMKRKQKIKGEKEVKPKVIPSIYKTDKLLLGVIRNKERITNFLNY